MKNNLISKLIAGTIIVGALSGCSTRPERKFPQGQITNVQYSMINQKIAPYKLEEQVLYNDGEYFQKTNKTEETLPIAIWRYNDVTRKIGSKSSKIELESEKTYIPTLVEITNKKGEKIKWAEKVNLRTDGPYALKAFMSPLNKSKVAAYENKFGYKIITTEDGASFAINTIKILDKEYFFPYIPNTSEEEGKFLPYLLIPIEDDEDTNKEAVIEIKNKCGNLSIYHKDKIYRPIETGYLEKLRKKWQKEGEELTNNLIKEGKIKVITNRIESLPNTNNNLIMYDNKKTNFSPGEVITN